MKNKESLKKIWPALSTTFEFALISFVVSLISSSEIAFASALVTLIATFVLKKYKYVKYVPIVAFVFSLFFYCPILSGIITSMAFIVMEHRWINKTNAFEWIGDVILPLYLCFIIEFLQKNATIWFISLANDQSTLHYGHLYGLATIVIFACFLHILFSKKISWYITAFVFGILGIVNFFVVSFTQQAFIPSDIKIARTGFACLGTQALVPEAIVRLVIGLVFLAIFVVAVTFLYKNENCRNGSVAKKCLTFLLVFSFLGVSYISIPVLKTNLLLFHSHSKYGFVTNFIINLDNGIHFPENLENYTLHDEDAQGEFSPNVIIVMNEAFSDLNGTFNLDGQDNLEYFNSLREKYPSGIAYSSVKGNNTCSSEWEVLSGISTGLTTKGAIIYQDNCKFMNSLVNVFNRRGYYTVGLHPYYGMGYNRNRVYEAIKFQDSVFMDSFTDPALKRGLITDEENYHKLIELYEQGEKMGNSPFFCLNITMQNHGGYENDCPDVIPFDTTSHNDVNQYLSLVNDADKMLKVLVDYFENVEEPTIILFFGDHQPAVENVFYEDYFGTDYDKLTTDQLRHIYEIPYLVWANYELDATANPGVVSINYLPSVLFDVGKIPSTTWLEKIKEFRKEWPVVTTNFYSKDGKTFLAPGEITGDPVLEEYKMWSYAVLKGEEYVN